MADAVVVIVTLDPRRDTPERLPAIAAAWGLRAGDHVLSGSIADVERTLADWGVAYARDGVNGEVVHASVFYVMARDGARAFRVDGGMGALGGLLPEL